MDMSSQRKTAEIEGSTYAVFPLEEWVQLETTLKLAMIELDGLMAYLFSNGDTEGCRRVVNLIHRMAAGVDRPR